MNQTDCVLPVKGTLRPMAYEPEENAQLLLSMRDVNNLPCPLEPRLPFLKTLCSSSTNMGFIRVIAPEIEFYLINEHSTDIIAGLLPNDGGTIQLYRLY